MFFIHLFSRAKAAGEAKADKDWRKAYAYYLSAVWCSINDRIWTRIIKLTRIILSRTSFIFDIFSGSWSQVRLFMKVLPAYESKEKKKEKQLISKQITELIDEATAVKQEAAVGRLGCKISRGDR